MLTAYENFSDNCVLETSEAEGPHVDVMVRFSQAFGHILFVPTHDTSCMSCYVD